VEGERTRRKIVRHKDTIGWGGLRVRIAKRGEKKNNGKTIFQRAISSPTGTLPPKPLNWERETAGERDGREKRGILSEP